MNTSARNALIALTIVVVGAAAIGAYFQFWHAESEVGATNNGQVAGEEDFSGVPDGMPETVTVKLNESKRAFGVNINPVEVEEDSRCPSDVQCIQAGTVRVRAMVAERGKPVESAAPIVFQLGTPMTVGLDQVTLISVEPAVRSGSQIAPSDYVFTFTVVKGGGMEYFKG